MPLTRHILYFILLLSNLQDIYMEHLALEIFDLTAGSGGTASKFAALPGDTAITIIVTSEIFASGDVWTFSFKLNTIANAHIFGSAGDLRGARLHDQINKRRARLWVDGLPLYLGHLKLADEAEVDAQGNVDVTFESGSKTFETMTDGANANQVPMIGDVPIGVALWRKRWVQHWLQFYGYGVMDDNISAMGDGVYDENGNNWIGAVYEGEDDGESVQPYPRFLFPHGIFRNVDTGGPVAIDCINTDTPYDDAHPYCHVALCYQRYGYEKKFPDGHIEPDYSAEPEAQRGYETMPADRVNSAPNFFVLYWIKALMTHLGINITENQMMDVEDLRRLFFVNTKCAYREPKKMRTGYDPQYTRYHFPSYGRYVAEYMDAEKNTNKESSSFTAMNVQVSDPHYTLPEGWTLTYPIPNFDHLVVQLSNVARWEEENKMQYWQHNDYLFDAYATSECFPDTSISDVMSAIKDGFGVRFLFDDNYQRVRIVLLKNVLNDTQVQHVKCEVVKSIKKDNCIRGFRMTYGKGKDDTEFFYKGFDDKLPHKKPYFTDDSDKHDYTKWELDARYDNIINRVTAFDTTCFVTPATGDAYGIKVDKDAKRYDELHPSLFEFAGYMDAEDGDCTGDDETIHTITLGFTPAIMNDLNMEQERKEGVHKQRFALFVDQAMRPRRPDLGTGQDYNKAEIYDVGKLYEDFSGMSSGGTVKPGEFFCTSDIYKEEKTLHTTIGRYVMIQKPNPGHLPDTKGMYVSWDVNFDLSGYFSEGCRLYLQDNFEPNDDGICPIEKKDWGLTLGIMRGSGSGAYVNYYEDLLDMEGNQGWDIMAGEDAISHPDICDNYGNEWDYSAGVTVCSTAAKAEEMLLRLYPSSNISLEGRTLSTYITITRLAALKDKNGRTHNVLVAISTASAHIIPAGEVDGYLEAVQAYAVAHDMTLMASDKALRSIFIQEDATMDSLSVFERLEMGAVGRGLPVNIDNNLLIRDGRLSLKLRAEKLNPYFNEKLPEDPDTNPRYLEIKKASLRNRGLIDTLYKDYSYWIRNARIVTKQVRITIAELQSIDKTKRVRIGDIVGFIRKIQYQVDIRKGMGLTSIEIMYI